MTRCDKVQIGVNRGETRRGKIGIGNHSAEIRPHEDRFLLFFLKNKKLIQKTFDIESDFLVTYLGFFFFFSLSGDANHVLHVQACIVESRSDTRATQSPPPPSAH